MVLVVVQRDRLGRVVRVECSGHAGFADPDEGGDIVCAGVSALTGLLGLTLAEVLSQPQAVGAQDGLFWFQRPSLEPEQERALELLLQGWLLAIQGMEENYSGWVKLEQRSDGTREAASER